MELEFYSTIFYLPINGLGMAIFKEEIPIDIEIPWRRTVKIQNHLFWNEGHLKQDWRFRWKYKEKEPVKLFPPIFLVDNTFEQ
jgi:hypothetical protein